MLMQMTIILIRGTVPSSRYLSAPAQHIEIITKNSSGPVSYPPSGKTPLLAIRLLSGSRSRNQSRTGASRARLSSRSEQVWRSIKVRAGIPSSERTPLNRLKMPPGMPHTAIIKTGECFLLAYLTQPLLRRFNGAMAESVLAHIQLLEMGERMTRSTSRS